MDGLLNFGNISPLFRGMEKQIAVVFLLIGLQFFVMNNNAPVSTKVRQTTGPPACWYDSNGNCLPCYGTDCLNERCCIKENRICCTVDGCIPCPDKSGLKEQFYLFEDEFIQRMKENPKWACYVICVGLLYAGTVGYVCYSLNKKLNATVEENMKKRKLEREERRLREAENEDENNNKAKTKDETREGLAIKKSGYKNNENTDIEEFEDVPKKKKKHRRHRKGRKHRG